jgi:polar amino acid transport system substrate-binding protein
MKRLVAIAVVACLVGACGGPGGEPPVRTTPVVTVLPPDVQSPAVISSRAAPPPCVPQASYRPIWDIQPGSTMARIRADDRLVVGIGPSAYLLSFRDPHDNGRVKGFEAEIAREIAFAILGDREKVTFQALNTAERIPAIRGKTVDMVLAAMTMACDRWQEVAFSVEYYSAGQAVLVPRTSGVRGIDDLAGRKVCASATSTNIPAIASRPAPPIPVAAANTSDCLLMLQQGQVDAVSTGDVILAGLAAQDPSMQIRGPRFTTEPTGIAMSRDATDLVRFVNGVLDRMITSGQWTRLQADWIGPHLPRQIQDTVVPPQPTYLPE